MTESHLQMSDSDLASSLQETKLDLTKKVCFMALGCFNEMKNSAFNFFYDCAFEISINLFLLITSLYECVISSFVDVIHVVATGVVVSVVIAYNKHAKDQLLI